MVLYVIDQLAAQIHDENLRADEDGRDDPTEDKADHPSEPGLGRFEQRAVKIELRPITGGLDHHDPKYNEVANWTQDPEALVHEIRDKTQQH